MTFQDIIDTALELARKNNVFAVPGKLAETYAQSLYQEWVDTTRPRLCRIKGVLGSSAGQSYPVPGYRDVCVVKLGGDVICSVGQDHLYLNEDEEVTVSKGFVVRDEKITFTGSESDVEAGASYEVIYYSDNLELSDTQEPFVPSKLHLNFAKELAYRFRIDFAETQKDKVLTPAELYERKKNTSHFRSEVGGRTTESKRPVDYDGFYTSGMY